MKHLVGKVITKEVQFMDDKVEVRKLSVSEVMAIQDLVKKAASSKKDDSQLGVLRDVLRRAVIGAEEMTDQEFDSFPLAELNKLSEAVLGFSGMGDGGSSGN
jgi:hypothetical protein